jgi:integrase
MGNRLPANTQRYLDAGLASAKRYQLESRSPETWINDHRIWGQFSEFLGSRDPWKATAEEVAGWCAWMVESGLSVRTVQSRLSSLNFYYERLGKGFAHGQMGVGLRLDNPVRAQIVRETMRGIRIVHRRTPKRKAPIDLETLESLLNLQPNNLNGIRNKAILALTWGGALRIGEVLGLNDEPNAPSRGHVQIKEDGLIVVLRKQQTRKRKVYWEIFAVPARPNKPQFCPSALLQNWLDVRGNQTGILFPSIRYKRIQHAMGMRRKTVNDILQDSLGELGLPANSYGTRSLRSGCIAWLLREGVHIGLIMEHSGFLSMEAMASHLQSADVLKSSPLSETSWCR